MSLADVQKAMREKVVNRVWICSDLQQWDPEIAREMLDLTLADFEELSLPCEQIWNLGDSTDGRHYENMQKTILLQAEKLETLGLPIFYTFGNHDFDLLKKEPERGLSAVPAWEILKPRPLWNLPPRISDFYFCGDFGDYRVYFTGDHAAPDASWIVTHGQIHGDEAAYPHTKEAYEALRQEMMDSRRPIIGAGHYAFPGGNRPSALLGQLLPLPPSYKVHFYGHAHLGEERLLGEHNYRKFAYTDFQHIPQVDVAALECRKASFVRSVFLEIYQDQSMGIFSRNHQNRVWEEALFLSPERQP